MTETPQPAEQPMPPLTGPAGPPRPTRWHIPVGVIAVALSVLGLMGPLFTLIGTAVNPQQQELMASLPGWYQSYTRAGTFVGAGIAVLLLGGGILLLKRRPACRPMLLTYAVLAILSNLIGTAATFKAFSNMSGTGQQAEVMRVGMVVGAVVGAAVGLALPVFLVIWFLRSKIRMDMRSWGA